MKRLLRLLSYLSISLIAISCAKDIVDLTGDIQGSVKDYDSGRLIGNCRVSLSPGGKSTSTDANGAFSFEDLEAGTYILSFSKSGYGDETQEVSVVTGQTSKVDVFLKLPSATTGKIAGTIKDYKNGQLISNCKVSITPSGKSVTSSSSGTFEFSDLTPGQYSVSFTKAGYDDENTTVTVTAGKTTTADALLKAKSSFALSETSYDFGDLEVSKTFYFFNYSDADCSFSIQNIPAWLSFNKITGTVTASGNEAVTATVDRSKVSEGSYNQNITVSYSGKESGSINLAIKMKKVVLSAPSVSIATSGENIKQNAFDISGSITATGGSQITNYGHCWNTSGNPTINDKHTDLGITDKILTFKSTADNLSTYTTYYVRAYAKNAQGITYSDVISVTTQNAASDKWDGNIATSFAGGSGTYIDPYIIKTGGQLLLAKNYSEKYFELGGNIDLNNKNWLPYEFKGTLDGKGNTIYNLFIQRSGDGQGLFSTLTGKVKNLTIIGVNISAPTSSNIGALAGVYGGSVSDVTVIFTSSSLICGNENVGGLVGISGWTISNINMECVSNQIVVKGNKNVGGIIGYCDAATPDGVYALENCTANLNLAGVSEIGGLVGYGKRCYDINRCSYKGSITGENAVGGILGSHYFPTVLTAVSSDIKITASSYAGGLVGAGCQSFYATMIACYSSGEITASNYCGGFEGGYSSYGDYGAKVFNSYTTVVSSSSKYYNFCARAQCTDCATVNSSSKETSYQEKCTNITKFLIESYSEYSSYWNFDNTWTWTGTIGGQTVNVSCPKLAWE